MEVQWNLSIANMLYSRHLSVSFPAMVKLLCFEPLFSGHLSIADTFSENQWCPLFRGFTVFLFYFSTVYFYFISPINYSLFKAVSYSALSLTFFWSYYSLPSYSLPSYFSHSKSVKSTGKRSSRSK